MHWIKQRRFLISGLLLNTLAFWIARLWMLLIFPAPEFRSDAVGYFKIVEEIMAGQWPSFFVRSPGYPLFEWFVFQFHQSFHAIVVAQVLFFWLASLGLITAFGRWRDVYALPVSIALSCFAFINATVIQDTMLYSDSFYTSMVLCFSACLVQFCHLPNSRRAIVLSLVTGFLIWTKIGAMFTIVLLLILALMVWMRERQKKVIVMLLSPVAIMLLSLMSYQNIHEGVFAFSPWGGFSKMGRSLPNWSTHPDYPDEVNAGIEKAMSKLDPKDREIMTSSWDARKVWQAYQNNWSRCRYGSFKASAPHLQDAFAQLGNDGVAANPIDYLRFVTSMATMHFWVYPTLDSQAHLVNHLHRHQQTLEKRNKDGARSVYFEPLYRPMSLNDFDQEPLFGFFHPYRDYMKTYTLLKPSLRHAFWPSIWMITLCFLIFRVFQSKFKDQILICSGCLCLAPLGAGLLVSMFEVAILRYSYPLEFIYYLSPFLLFIALPTSWTIKFQSWFGFFEQPTTKNIAFGFSVLLAFFITKQVLWSGLDSYGAKDMPLEELSMRIGAANHEALPQLARQLRNLKSYPHAIDASLETLRINPQHLHAQFELMLTREAMGDATAAAAELQKLLRMQPRTPLEIFLLGQAYIKNKNVNQAIQLYRNARKKFPNFHPSQFQGLSPQQKQQWDKILSSP